MSTEGVELNLTVESVGWEAMELFFGVDPRMVPKPKPLHSVLISTTEEVSGEPAKPERARGLWHWLKGTNRKRQEQYVRDHMRWVIDGKPTKTREVQHFIPRAHIV